MVVKLKNTATRALSTNFQYTYRLCEYNAARRSGVRGWANQHCSSKSAHNGHLFVFRGRRGSLIKILWHDGQRMCLFARRLKQGRSTAPSDAADRTVTITAAQLGYLLEGIDWRLPQH